MIVVEETHDISIKTSFFKAHRQEVMIQGRKKLCDIKCYDTDMALFEPPCSNKMGEIYTYINNRLLSDVSQLIWIQEAISYHVELESVADDFLNEFASSVEQNYGLERFGDAIQVFIQLGNDDNVGRLEMR